MAKKEKRATPGARLEALLAAGDARGARAEAARLLADPASSDVDREAARAAIERIRPEKAVVAALAAGIALYAVAVVLGLFWHR